MTGNVQAHPKVHAKDIDEIVIRSWPTVIFLYPLLFAGLICGVMQAFWGGAEDPSFDETIGFVFFAVFCVNILVISFEFSRFKTLAIFFFFLALFFFLLYLGSRLDWQIFRALRELLEKFHVRASSSLYFGIASYLAFTFGLVFISTRFNYWVIRSNEILHKEGFLGDVKRFPSPSLKMTKEINDVFEFLLLGSGRIVLYPASEKQAIVLEHVLRVNAAELAIQELLSSLQVEVEEHEHTGEEPAG